MVTWIVRLPSFEARDRLVADIARDPELAGIDVRPGANLPDVVIRATGEQLEKVRALSGGDARIFHDIDFEPFE
jgi:hypothetical protein